MKKINDKKKSDEELPEADKKRLAELEPLLKTE